MRERHVDSPMLEVVDRSRLLRPDYGPLTRSVHDYLEGRSTITSPVPKVIGRVQDVEDFDTSLGYEYKKKHYLGQPMHALRLSRLHPTLRPMRSPLESIIQHHISVNPNHKDFRTRLILQSGPVVAGKQQRNTRCHVDLLSPTQGLSQIYTVANHEPTISYAAEVPRLPISPDSEIPDWEIAQIMRENILRMDPRQVHTHQAKPYDIQWCDGLTLHTSPHIRRDGHRTILICYFIPR